MQITPEKAVSNLFTSYHGQSPDKITPLPASGSERRYFRIWFADQTLLAAYNPYPRENHAFITLSRHFAAKGLPVPQILAQDLSNHCYLVSDLGDTTLFSLLPHDPAIEAFDQGVMALYAQVVEWLAAFQIKGAQDLDFSICYPRQAFDRQSMMWDLNYFKYYYLKTSGIPFDEQKLEEDFGRFTSHLLEQPAEYFMYRDFQSRNIMIYEGSPRFIDYQGGRKGPLQYDIASLLFDAKANIPFEQRLQLLDLYIEKVREHIAIEEKSFRTSFYDFVVMRILQALGTYGFRGGIEKKALFLQSVPFAMNNLRWLVTNNLLPASTPYLSGLIEKIAAKGPYPESTSQPEGLTLTINSFSYRNGIPQDASGNGGGFVFDCRALPNPGREPAFKYLTGQNQPVIDYLQKAD
ncbi:MAG: RNase adapter RapZ, partial [Bacteroidales bacterium]